MTWLSNEILKVLATIIYIFVLFPFVMVLHLSFTVLALLLLPFNRNLINKSNDNKNETP